MNKTWNFKRNAIAASVLGTVASGAMISTTAFAAEEEAGSIDEIIVTASRREQSVQDVPASVVAVTPEDFTTKGLQDLEDVINYTPGIQFTPTGRPGEGTIAGRGIPQLGSGAVYGIYLDDTPLTGQTNFSNAASNFLDGLLMDIERVELVKGPQGTLFGASSVGGMLRYISRDPSLDEIRGSVGVDYSTTRSGDNGHTISGRVSLPIIEDKLGITLAGFTRDIGGYVDQVGGEEDYDSADIKGYSVDVLFQATDELDFRLKYLKQETASDAVSEVFLVPGTDEAAFGGYTSLNDPSSSEPTFEVYSLAVNYDFDFATLTSSTSVAENTLDATFDRTAATAPVVDSFIDAFNGDPAGTAAGTTTNVSLFRGSSSEKFSQEIRLTSAGESDWEWIAGIFYADEDTTNDQNFTITPAIPFTLGTAVFPSNYEEKAAFGSVTYYITEDFDVQVGARYSEVDVSVETTLSGVLVFGAFGVNLSQPIETSESVGTYLIAARYRVDEDLSLYSRIATGYRPTTPNIPLLGSDEIVESDESVSYEFGAKGSLADGLLTYDASLYYITYDDFQTEFSALGAGSLTNADGSLSAYGFDGAFTYLPTDNLSFILNLGYSRSKVDDDQPLTLGASAGDDLPSVPKLTGSLQWAYAFDVTDDWAGTFGGGIRYAGDSVTSFDTMFANPVELDSRTVTDLNLNLTDGTYSATLYATNLFNEREVISRTDVVAVPDGPTVASQGIFERPREIGINLRMEF